jgi:surface polysaccharide O-acyltransferase-like enzyme
MHKAGYLGYVHSFRGFAILNVVAVHAFALAMLIPRDWVGDPTAPLFVLSETLFHDSTVYFALISGLLFSSILRSRGYQNFYRSKARYVLIPYIFCTILFSLMRWDETGTGILAWPPSWSDYIDSILPNLMHGEAQFTYWYIPVLLILFAITPLLSVLTTAKSYAAIPAWLVMLAPLVFSHPDFGEGSSQIAAGTVIYFAGAYTVGVYLGNHLETLLDRIAAYRNLLIASAVLSSALLVELQLAQVNRFGGYSLQESLFYVQKLSLAALVLLWLRTLEARQPRWLTYFADEAFSIYFLHVFFILLLADLSWEFLRNSAFLPWTIYVSGPLYIAFALAMSVLVVRLMRLLFGRNSRLLIGS